MREITTIDPKWLTEYAPSFYQFSVGDKRNNKEKILPLFNRNETNDEWRISKIKKIV
jgi:hypothetical protein